MQTDQDLNAGALSAGRFILSGPTERGDPRYLPLRGDLAHIALAGRYFVPHYVVPLQRMVGDMGANLRADPREESEILFDLSPGQRFDMLDTTGEWAWGCCGEGGLVGYVRRDELLDPFS